MVQLLPATKEEALSNQKRIGDDSPAAAEKSQQDGGAIMKSYEVGMLVRHPTKPEWGLGRVLTVEGEVLKIFFKNDKDQDYRAIVTSRVAPEPADEQSDPVLDNLPPFDGQRFAGSAKKVTVRDGLERFMEIFPLGFEDSSYLERERNYKWKAHERCEAALSGRGRELLAGGDVDALTSAALSIAGLNLLSPYELMAFRDGLLADREAAAAFFEALFDVTEQELDKQRFERLAAAVSDLPSKPGGARVATWPVLTVLPYLARPDRFMFLKPEPTRACAERLRFELQYGSDLRWITYARLMALADDLYKELRPLGARDYIDVQSFMWVIAKY